MPSNVATEIGAQIFEKYLSAMAGEAGESVEETRTKFRYKIVGEIPGDWVGDESLEIFVTLCVEDTRDGTTGFLVGYANCFANPGGNFELLCVTDYFEGAFVIWNSPDYPVGQYSGPMATTVAFV